MIEALVEAELLLHMLALVLAAGDADRTRALDLRDLPDRGADRAGRRRDDDGLARLRLADIEQAGIGGHAGHAEHTDRGRDRRKLRIDLVQALAVGQRMCLPAGARQHDIALGEGGIVGGDHLVDGARFHHAPDRHRRGVGRPVAHAPAHIGIERQPDRAQQHLAVAGRRYRHVFDAEVRWLRLADGTRCQNDALGLGHGGFLRSFCSSLRANAA